MLTVQKITAILRKAGLKAAKYHASKMVRGYGKWTSGFKVERVYTSNPDYTQWNGKPKRLQTTQVRISVHGGTPIASVLDALKEAGVDYGPTDSYYVIIEGVETNN